MQNSSASVTKSASRMLCATQNPMLKYTILQIRSVLNATWYSPFGKGEDFKVGEVVELVKSVSLSRLSMSLWSNRECFGALRKNRANMASKARILQQKVVVEGERC